MFPSALLIDDDVPFGLRASVEAALRMPPPSCGTTLPAKLQQLTASLLADADADILTVLASSTSEEGGDEPTYQVSLC